MTNTDSDNLQPDIFCFVDVKLLNLQTGEVMNLPNPAIITRPYTGAASFDIDLAKVTEFELVVTGSLDKSLDKNGYSIEMIRSWSPGLRAFYWLTGLLPFDWWWCLKHPGRTTSTMMWGMKNRWRKHRRKD